MASTTLVTFLYECQSAAQTVELLGSWDNFCKPYQLKRDLRRSSAIWTGCWTFDNIICDGDLNNLCARRNGALKMGGTYWYYYKVDDNEQHNPSEPSTAVCPLLPGQRLNVLDVPSDSSSSSESSGVFTRNPADRYLTPVPPKPLHSPRLGDLCQEKYQPPTHPVRTPTSATYPPSDRSLTPKYGRRARSASTSHQPTSGTNLMEFKGLKDKLVSKRAASSTKGHQRNVKELQIGAPTLISTTAVDVNLVPLSSLRTPQPASFARTQQTSSTLTPPLTAKMMKFSPLGSNPVDPIKDLSMRKTGEVSNEDKQLPERPRSHSPEIISTKLESSPARVRANSAGTRRTRNYFFANEPWTATPKWQEDLIEEVQHEESEEVEVAPAPVLQRPSASLEPPSLDERPTSSHGSARSPGLLTSPRDKELPALPRYLVPAPLFACSNSIKSPTLAEDQGAEQEEPGIELVSGNSSQFSTRSAESMTFSSTTEDDDAIHSPSFSSLTTDSSDVGSPQRLSRHFALGDEQRDTKHDLTTADANADIDSSEPSFSASPPQLAQLRISTFGASLFSKGDSRASSASRRHASIFAAGFQGYSLPEDETTSQATITKPALQSEPRISPARDSSVSHLGKLMDEFGYLGDAVL
ncbi:hypothetical protein BDV95DRAFT_604266 [Massariosphaeria phaeospora]|uniref:Uncharacterized protein n=1 Tax=Massariosphaeria phaeospora TaxID=100035 RepID=A0A7C8ID34_9PLEO|nr:hypothetical protein BDV95DRAFT_604266 [Massariosphaeria phaeospora]